jgi:hypothetical protein
MATLVARNTNEVAAPMVGSGGSLESGGWFCVVPFGRNLASFDAKMSTNLIYFTKKLYKFCTFNAIFKDNAAINCITVQHNKQFNSRQL